MRYLLAAGVVLPTLALAVGMLRGRARVRACCPPPEHDARLRP